MQEGTACGNNATYRKEQHATLPVAPPHTNTYPGRVRTVWLFPPMVYLLTLTVWFIRKKKEKQSRMKEVLLHCCCAPCSSAIIEWMMANGTRPTLYFCNPNIYPEQEYLIRKQELLRYASQLSLRVIDDESMPSWTSWSAYHASWLSAVRGMEDEPERGPRCLLCFKLRLLSAARMAQREGIKVFTTTLASSRWKSIVQIAEAGEWAAQQVGGGVMFDARNWRKGGLQQRRNELLRENGFYNQLYCGCEFSLRQTEQRMAQRDAAQVVATDTEHTTTEGTKLAATECCRESK